MFYSQTERNLPVFSQGFSEISLYRKFLNCAHYFFANKNWLFQVREQTNCFNLKKSEASRKCCEFHLSLIVLKILQRKLCQTSLFLNCRCIKRTLKKIILTIFSSCSRFSFSREHAIVLILQIVHASLLVAKMLIMLLFLTTVSRDYFSKIFKKTIKKLPKLKISQRDTSFQFSVVFFSSIKSHKAKRFKSVKDLQLFHQNFFWLAILHSKNEDPSVQVFRL